MIMVCHMRRAWWVLGLIRLCRHGAPEAEARGGQNRTVTLRGSKAGRFMRVLASGLMLHATFPLDALAQTAPSSTAAVPATPAMTAQPSQTVPPPPPAAPPSSTAAPPAVPAVTAQPSQAAPRTALPSSTAAVPSAPPATPMPAETGMSEADRRQVQESLHRLNYYQGPTDGIFGPLTRAAIGRFQHDIDAASTGYLTEEEANRLVGTPAAVAQPATGQPFNREQLDALVASIALYPDELLTQVLMASTFPLEIVAAARWVEDPAHKALSGEALVKALEAEPWDPSVKSLVPFPVVLATLNSNLIWLQQLGYAFATQQADVFAAVQRLRRLAQANGKLESSPEQVVSTRQVTTEPASGSGQAPTQQEMLFIEPARPDTVYVPSYNPGVVYGSSWPYPSYPPYYAAPPTGYYFGAALATGLAFAAGAAVVGGLWGWANPSWGGGYANVNVNQFNSINANRSQIASSRWGASTAGGRRAPGGPVGLPGRSQVSGTGQCGAASNSPGRPGRYWRSRSAGRRWRRGQHRRSGSARRSRRRRRRRRSWSARWSRGRGRRRRSGSARRSRGRGQRRRSGSARRSRRRGRCRRSGSARRSWERGRRRWPWSAGRPRPRRRCRGRQQADPAGGCAAPGRCVWRYAQRASGWPIRAAGCAKPFPWSAATVQRRRAQWRPHTWRRWRRARRRWRPWRRAALGGH